LGREVDVAPRRVPRPVEGQLRDVVQEITVNGAAPIEDRADPVAGDEHVEVDQVVVHDMTLFRTVVDELAEARVTLFERSNSGGRAFEDHSPAGRATRGWLVHEAKEPLAPAGMTRPRVRAPESEA